MVGGVVDGPVVVVWGSTGAGKSTLANRLLGLEYDINGMIQHEELMRCLY
jgi:ABC-type transport system involved in cytochrome bd biosynthesis fused ATPase/permease subunit